MATLNNGMSSPEAKSDAAHDLWTLSHESAANTTDISEQGGIQALVWLLSSGNAEAKANAAGALCQISRDMIYQGGTKTHGRKIVSSNGIQPLVTLLSSGNAEAQEGAAGVLHNLSCNGTFMPEIIANANAVPRLVALLSSGSLDAKDQAAAALSNLANDDGNRVPIMDAGAITPLVNLVTADTRADVMKGAVEAIGQLSTNEHVQPIIVQNDRAIPNLISALSFHDQPGYPVWVLDNLTDVGDIVIQRAQPAIPRLRQLVAQQVEWAQELLDKLLQ